MRYISDGGAQAPALDNLRTRPGRLDEVTHHARRNDHAQRRRLRRHVPPPRAVLSRRCYETHRPQVLERLIEYATWLRVSDSGSVRSKLRKVTLVSSGGG